MKGARAAGGETEWIVGRVRGVSETAAVLGANYPGNDWYDKAYGLVQDHAAGVNPS